LAFIEIPALGGNSHGDIGLKREQHFSLRNNSAKPRLCHAGPQARYRAALRYRRLWLATMGAFMRKTPIRREEIPARPQTIDRWRGENGGLRTAKNPSLEWPLLARSGHWRKNCSAKGLLLTQSGHLVFVCIYGEA